jgi:DNA-binding NarL/FixJ family response regulator
LVEDSWVVGDALKQLLELLRANVSGPAATIAEAERLLAQHLPDVALVDIIFEGENNPTCWLHGWLSMAVIILSGSPESFPVPLVEGTRILEKPVSEAALLEHLRPLIAKKATR